MNLNSFKDNHRGSVRGGLCSLRPSTFYPVLPAPHFSALAPLYQFSPLLIHLYLRPAPFNLFLLLPDNFSCSLLHFPIFCCSLLPFSIFCAPCSHITCSLLPAPFVILGHAPCSLGCQGPFSLLPDYP